MDLNHRPLGYEPSGLPGCPTPLPTCAWRALFIKPIDGALGPPSVGSGPPFTCSRAVLGGAGMARLRAVLFDAFGTLLDAGGLHLEATEAILAELGLSGRVGAEELHRRWDEHLMAFWQGGRFSKTWDMFMASLWEALRDFGVSVRPDELEVAGAILLNTFSKTRLYEGARDILSFCRSLGLRTGIVSDADASLLRSLLSKHGLMALLDAIVISDEVGFLKPDPRVFETALRAVGCEAGEALMVGDARRDIEGAKGIGMLAALVLHAGRGLPELSVEPDIIVGSLAELRGPIAVLAGAMP